MCFNLTPFFYQIIIIVGWCVTENGIFRLFKGWILIVFYNKVSNILLEMQILICNIIYGNISLNMQLKIHTIGNNKMWCKQVGILILLKYYNRIFTFYLEIINLCVNFAYGTISNSNLYAYKEIILL